MYKADIVIFDYAIAAPFILPAGTDVLNAHLRNRQVLPLKFRVPH